MGTNYYWHKPENVCEHCGRGDGAEFHIGKSSSGWVFNLRIHPDEGIKELGDWLERWERPGSKIFDEYGQEVSVRDMIATILARWWREDGWSSDKLRDNHAVAGPLGLAMAADAVPSKHGPYALNEREFS